MWLKHKTLYSKTKNATKKQKQNVISQNNIK